MLGGSREPREIQFGFMCRVHHGAGWGVDGNGSAVGHLLQTGVVVEKKCAMQLELALHS